MFAHAHHLLSGAQKTAKKCLPFWRVQATEEIAIAHDYLTQRGGAERVVSPVALTALGCSAINPVSRCRCCRSLRPC